MREDRGVRDVVILGSTGSIGVQALEVVAANPDKFRVVGLSAGSANLPLLFEQAIQFGVQIVGTSAEKSPDAPAGVKVLHGARASSEIATIKCDVLINGITGSIGLAPTLAALEAGNIVALANKESLVAGGSLVMKYGRDRIIPVDSEHSALFQCMLAGKESEISKVILTASGGAFRDRQDLSGVTLQEALAHPTWSMGPVVTINSASLMNKALEIIEAHYLFDLPYSKIDAVIHPQSFIHSLVEYHDGSTLAQASPPNMKGPIAYAMGYPSRVKGATPAIDWSTAMSWEFRPIDNKKFPAIEIAKEVGALASGPTIMNAANESAVSAFIEGKLSFVGIMDVVSRVLDTMSDVSKNEIRSFDDVSAIEENARMRADHIIQAGGK
jgi:1-deoxy-D-xylulose-5-phosphate reductoisomerase